MSCLQQNLDRTKTDDLEAAPNVENSPTDLVENHNHSSRSSDIPKRSPESPETLLSSAIKSCPFEIGIKKENEIQRAFRVLEQEEERSTDNDDDGGYAWLGAELIGDQCNLDTEFNKEGQQFTQNCCQASSSGTTSSPNSPISVSSSCDPPDSLAAVHKANIVPQPIEAISVDYGLVGHDFELTERKVFCDGKPDVVQVIWEERNRDQLEERNDSDDQQEDENDMGNYASAKRNFIPFHEDSEENSDEEPNNIYVV